MKERERELIEKGAEAIKFEIKRLAVGILEYPLGKKPWDWRKILSQTPYLPDRLPIDYFLNKTNVGLYYKSKYPDFERALRKALENPKWEWVMINMVEPPIEEEKWRDLGDMLVKEFSVHIICKPKDGEETAYEIPFRLWRKKKL